MNSNQFTLSPDGAKLVQVSRVKEPDQYSEQYNTPTGEQDYMYDYKDWKDYVDHLISYNIAEPGRDYWKSKQVFDEGDFKLKYKEILIRPGYWEVDPNVQQAHPVVIPEEDIQTLLQKVGYYNEEKYDKCNCEELYKYARPLCPVHDKDKIEKNKALKVEAMEKKTQPSPEGEGDLDDQLRSYGYDPDAVEKRGIEFIRKLKSQAQRDQLAIKEGSAYAETSQARVIAFKNGWDACIEYFQTAQPLPSATEAKGAEGLKAFIADQITRRNNKDATDNIYTAFCRIYFSLTGTELTINL